MQGFELILDPKESEVGIKVLVVGLEIFDDDWAGSMDLVALEDYKVLEDQGLFTDLAIYMDLVGCKVWYYLVGIG
jgi:hypothetical protein